MPRLSSLDDLAALYAARGGQTYGEGVTQLEHAVQCAGLAEAAGAAPSLVAAALLHDVGHLFLEEAEATTAAQDDRHEITGARALSALFGRAVRGPIALHVPAKRWLCLRQPGYLDALSPASAASLALQGGPFDEGGAAAFERKPYWRQAVALRRWDDLGKDLEPCGRTFADFAPLLRSLQRDQPPQD
ncbi:HD domain-containing protein [Caulobacter sp. KR2-114]|uniref:HD domain-containing protein n=1 Tax=Caulobacter sp. KR2-114 TaxID=3400912 RepID=UPI003C063916